MRNLISAIVVFLVIYCISNNIQSKDSKGVKVEVASQDSKTSKSISKKAEPAKKCELMTSVTYRLVQKVDQNHYLLLANGSDENASKILMETDRELSGDNIQFTEGTYLGAQNTDRTKLIRDFSKVVFKWREGCSN